MAITTGSHPKKYWPGVAKFFGVVYDKHPEEYRQLFDTVSSSKSYEERVHDKGLGLAPIKAQGASISFEDTEQMYVSRITNITYAIGGIITREAIEDNQYETLAKQIAYSIAFSLQQTRENVGGNIYNRAFNSTYTGGDGLELCSTAHVTADGTQSNELAVAADLTHETLENMLIQIGQATDTNGLKISITGQKLIIPIALQFEAARILESVLQSGTANNDKNVINGMLEIVPNHYLSDADAWFIRTNAPNGMICQKRRATEFGKDNDFDTENAKMKGSFREGFGWADWRQLYGSPGA